MGGKGPPRALCMIVPSTTPTATPNNVRPSNGSARMERRKARRPVSLSSCGLGPVESSSLSSSCSSLSPFAAVVSSTSTGVVAASPSCGFIPLGRGVLRVPSQSASRGRFPGPWLTCRQSSRLMRARMTAAGQSAASVGALLPSPCRCGTLAGVAAVCAGSTRRVCLSGLRIASSVAARCAACRSAGRRATRRTHPVRCHRASSLLASCAASVASVTPQPGCVHTSVARVSDTVSTTRSVGVHTG